MHDRMPYGRNQGQGHSREVDRQSPMGLIFFHIDVHSICYSRVQKNNSTYIFTDSDYIRALFLAKK